MTNLRFPDGPPPSYFDLPRYEPSYAPKHPRKAPKFFTDDNGTEFVAVHIPQSPEPAVLEACVYRWLLGKGVSGNWSLTHGGYVRAPSGCEAFTGLAKYGLVARLITGADHGQRVSYRDNNPLHLWRDNLRLT